MITQLYVNHLNEIYIRARIELWWLTLDHQIIQISETIRCLIYYVLFNGIPMFDTKCMSFDGSINLLLLQQFIISFDMIIKIVYMRIV